MNLQEDYDRLVAYILEYLKYERRVFRHFMHPARFPRLQKLALNIPIKSVLYEEQFGSAEKFPAEHFPQELKDDPHYDIYRNRYLLNELAKKIFDDLEFDFSYGDLLAYHREREKKLFLVSIPNILLVFAAAVATVAENAPIGLTESLDIPRNVIDYGSFFLQALVLFILASVTLPEWIRKILYQGKFNFVDQVIGYCHQVEKKCANKTGDGNSE